MIWNFKCHSNNIAVIDDQGNTLTYQQLAEHTERLCSVVGKRCLVFSMCENEIGSLIGYIAFLNGGIVPAMLKHDLDAEMLANLYKNYQPAFIWLPNDSVSSPLFSDCQNVYQDYGYSLLRTPFINSAILYPDLALLLTTSGSTGSPKFVRQSYENIRANTDSIVEYLHLDSSEKPITTLPMNYTYGLSIINSHLDVGATILLTNCTLMQKEFWGFFKKQGATSFGGVPFTYEMLKKLRFFNMDLPSLRTMTQAGGKILVELHKEFATYAHEHNREFIVMYGQCEATARMAYLPNDKNLEKIGSMGIPIPGGRFELIDLNGEVITNSDVVGELVYYGKNVTLGYATTVSDLAKGDEFQGRLCTGDMAKRDSDGYYYIVGRKKRFLKIFGNRVNLDETERMLKAEFQNCDVACGGVDDQLWIFSTDGELLSKMKSFLSEKTGLNQAAFKMRELPAIPHNESGKVLYKELEKFYD